MNTKTQLRVAVVPVHLAPSCGFSFYCQELLTSHPNMHQHPFQMSIYNVPLGLECPVIFCNSSLQKRSSSHDGQASVSAAQHRLRQMEWSLCLWEHPFPQDTGKPSLRGAGLLGNSACEDNLPITKEIAANLTGKSWKSHPTGTRQCKYQNG